MLYTLLPKLTKDKFLDLTERIVITETFFFLAYNEKLLMIINIIYMLCGLVRMFVGLFHFFLISLFGLTLNYTTKCWFTYGYKLLLFIADLF